MKIRYHLWLLVQFFKSHLIISKINDKKYLKHESIVNKEVGESHVCKLLPQHLVNDFLESCSQHYLLHELPARSGITA